MEGTTKLKACKWVAMCIYMVHDPQTAVVQTAFSILQTVSGVVVPHHFDISTVKIRLLERPETIFFVRIICSTLVLFLHVLSGLALGLHGPSIFRHTNR